MLSCLLDCTCLHSDSPVFLPPVPPSGSDAPIPCTPGYYCDVTALPTPTNSCAPGYYCTLGAITPTPTDGSTGDECPAGFYCGEGSPYPLACPLGTYSPALRNEDITDCQNCTHGMYCGEHNLTGPSGKGMEKLTNAYKFAIFLFMYYIYELNCIIHLKKDMQINLSFEK